LKIDQLFAKLSTWGALFFWLSVLF